MILKEVLEVSQKSDRVIIEDEERNLLYIGYVGMIEHSQEEVKESSEVTKISYKQDLIGRDEEGKFRPLEAGSVADVVYSNIEERLYLYIRVKN